MNERESQLIAELRRRELASGAELAAALNMSQPTLSRALAALPPSRLHRVGGGRSTRYAWRREVAGRTRWPLYRLDEAGEPHRVATLHPLTGAAWHVELEAPWPSMRSPLFPNMIFPDWPWFLDDLRPMGFLGRLFARTCADLLRVPRDPRAWSAEQTVRALSRFGSDLPGAWILGEDMLASVRAPPSDDLPATLTSNLLLSRAEYVMEGRWPGSSAAGEQPKYTLELKNKDGGHRSLLVKFSGDISNPVQARWADLLRAEHLANGILRAAGIAAAQTTLHEAGNRVFLLGERFDRTPSRGRRALVSLHALNAAFGDVNRNWAASAEDLHMQGWVDETGAGRMGVLWWFGQLIGNTDMHDGNLSLFFPPEPPLQLAPVYDMTPMALAPRPDGTLPERPPIPAPPPPEQTLAYEQAKTLAKRFREQVLHEKAFSVSFRNAFLSE